MVNSGQVCLAAKRVYVHDSMYDAFCAELAKLAETAVIGNGPDPATQFGRLQNKGQYEKVQGYIDEARRRGRIVAGGTREPGSGYFIRPMDGAKQSGFGTEMGLEGLEEFTQAKIINIAPYG